MLEIGTNLAPALLSPDEARAVVPAGAWLRFVANNPFPVETDENPQGDATWALHRAGFKLLVVLTKASLAQHTAVEWADEYDWADAVQVINEPDAAPGSPSSDVMGQEEVRAHLGAVSDAFSDAVPIIGPGLCSGQPGWWNWELNFYVDAIAVHPYGKSPREAAELLQAYHDRWETPIWVTEYVDPDHPDGGQLVGLLEAFRKLPFVTVAISYGLSPAWSNGFGGGHVPEFKLGMLQWVKDHPDVDCGQPLEDEFYYGPAHSQQMTTTGMFFYSGGSTNAVQFVARPK